jgi:hypothetical protein
MRVRAKQHVPEGEDNSEVGIARAMLERVVDAVDRRCRHRAGGDLSYFNPVFRRRFQATPSEHDIVSIDRTTDFHE